MSIQGKRIFIVEDNSINRSIYTQILRRAGAVIEFDRWGRDTLRLLNGFSPHLIVLDLMLNAGITGFDVFDHIRAEADYANVPIVAISAAEPTLTLAKCRTKGFSGFIAKPIEEHLLAEQLEQVMQGQAVWYLGERYGGNAG